METIDGRAKLAQLASPVLEKLPSGVFRTMMFQHLEELVGLKSGHLDKGGRQQNPSSHRQGVARSAKQQRATPIRTAIALLLDSPHLVDIAEGVENEWQNWDAPGIIILKQLLEIIRSQPTLNKAALLERWRDTEHFNHLNALASYRFDLPDMDREAELRDALLKLNEQYRKSSRPKPGNLPPSELSDELLNELKRRYPGTLSQDEQ
jgi:DNA primase